MGVGTDPPYHTHSCERPSRSSISHQWVQCADLDNAQADNTPGHTVFIIIYNCIIKITIQRTTPSATRSKNFALHILKTATNSRTLRPLGRKSKFCDTSIGHFYCYAPALRTFHMPHPLHRRSNCPKLYRCRFPLHTRETHGTHAPQSPLPRRRIVERARARALNHNCCHARHYHKHRDLIAAAIFRTFFRARALARRDL